MCSPLNGFLLFVSLKAYSYKWRFGIWLYDAHFVLRRWTKRSDAHRRDWLSVVMQSFFGRKVEHLTPWCTPRSLTYRWDAHHGVFSFKFEYLGDIETEFENTLAWLSGAQMSSNNEKNRGNKSRDTLPLRQKCTMGCDYFFEYCNKLQLNVWICST